MIEVNLMLFSLLVVMLTPQSISTHVEQTLQAMTLDEKLGYLGGERSMFLHGIPRLGLPELKMSDGPAGVRCWGPTTAYPAPVCLAASWNLDLARRFGRNIGRDCRARGVHIWLGPGVNLARIPQNGRNFEYYGEDPFLAGALAENVIQKVQAEGVSATVKHFVANDHENDRNNDSSDMDERTLRELYLVPFEAAVRRGDAGCAMSGYNLVNGVHCTQQNHLVNDVLKRDWGFKGIFMSDWDATYDPLAAAVGGLDLEMPSPLHLNAEKLKPLVAGGSLKEEVIDDKVRRILRTIYTFRWDRRPQELPSVPKDDPEAAKTALDIAREGIVLLKNVNGFLPLKKTGRVIVTGPNGDRPATGGGGSSFTDPFAAISVEQGLRKVAGKAAHIERIATTPDFAGGLSIGPWKAEYFPNPDLSGKPALERAEPKIDFDWGGGSPDAKVPDDLFSARWTSTAHVPEGRYTVLVEADDGIRAFIDGKPALDDWSDHSARRKSATVSLSAGSHDFTVEYYERRGSAVARFALVPDKSDATGAMAKIKAADAVIACVGFDKGSEGEGLDRPFQLPKEQQELLDQLVQTSSSVVLVVNSGAGVDLSPWAGKVAAIVQAWYPGQSGNQALAEILYGVVNPSGKLPTSFPRTLEGTYYQTAYPAVNNKMPYSEGVFMGYRWLDRAGVEPLFPFGFGLSYTTFSMSDPSASADHAGVRVTNTGSRAGAEVVQVYVGEDKPAVERPKRELKGFAKVFLRPGESKLVTVPLDARSFAYWQDGGWAVGGGDYTVWVGASSRDLPLSVHVKVQASRLAP